MTRDVFGSVRAEGPSLALLGTRLTTLIRRLKLAGRFGTRASIPRPHRAGLKPRASPVARFSQSRAPVARGSSPALNPISRLKPAALA
ncbi:MAG: hypothetical protein KatS3mg059_1603 [Thermomicrobiales bacterium]|nr:MAG: hypothetical protein KatS3mg059_1603 [Thermomicrobiales bacterium]